MFPGEFHFKVNRDPAFGADVFLTDDHALLEAQLFLGLFGRPQQTILQGAILARLNRYSQLLPDMRDKGVVNKLVEIIAPPVPRHAARTPGG